MMYQLEIFESKPRKNPPKYRWKKYPNAFYVFEMIFYMSVESGKRKMALGKPLLLFVGNHYVSHLYSNSLLINSSFVQ